VSVTLKKQPPTVLTTPSELTPPADEGMATAEYAVATLAACGFAALLLTILRSDEVRNLLLSLITRALGMA
jgi:hypothetical protein